MLLQKAYNEGFKHILNFLSFPTTANIPPILISSGSMPFSAPKRPNSIWSALEAGFLISSVQPPSGELAHRPDTVKVCDVLS